MEEDIFNYSPTVNSGTPGMLVDLYKHQID